MEVAPLKNQKNRLRLSLIAIGDDKFKRAANILIMLKNLELSMGRRRVPNHSVPAAEALILEYFIANTKETTKCGKMMKAVLS